MSRNVNEFCWDWSGEYSSGSQTNPRDQMPIPAVFCAVVVGTALRSAAVLLSTSATILTAGAITSGSGWRGQVDNLITLDFITFLDSAEGIPLGDNHEEKLYTMRSE